MRSPVRLLSFGGLCAQPPSPEAITRGVHPATSTVQGDTAASAVDLSNNRAGLASEFASAQLGGILHVETSHYNSLLLATMKQAEHSQKGRALPERLWCDLLPDMPWLCPLCSGSLHAHLVVNLANTLHCICMHKIALAYKLHVVQFSLSGACS